MFFAKPIDLRRLLKRKTKYWYLQSFLKNEFTTGLVTLAFYLGKITGLTCFNKFTELTTLKCNMLLLAM